MAKDIKKGVSEKSTEIMYLNIQQPAAMQERGNMAVNWNEWKKSFDYFLTAAGREKASQKEKCALFLHVIGKYGREIYEEFDFDGSNENYDLLVTKFNDRFDPKININFERHMFFETYQKENSFDDFASDLKIKSKRCEFGSLRSSLILTQIIRGLKDSQMRERLLSRLTLNLEEAESCCRAAERASAQAAACSGRSGRGANDDGESPSGEVEQLRREGAGRRPASHRDRCALPPAGPAAARRPHQAVCVKCTRWHSDYDRCPAYSVKCYKCDRYGHYAKCCKTRMIREVKDCGKDLSTDCKESEGGEFFVYNLYIDATNNSSKESWSEFVFVNNVLVKFKLDTGADTSVMSIKSFLKAGFTVDILSKTNIILKEISKNTLPVVGYFTPQIKYQKYCSKQKIYVLDVECNNLLGLKACSELKLIARINELSEFNLETTAFEGIGCLPNSVMISVDESVQPVVSTSRKIPLRLRPRLKEELDNMEKLGIIVREDAPTDWVSGIVVVEKPDKSVRVCLDPFHLNKAVRRNHFQLPTLEEIASELNGANFFSKLDAKKGFWMLKLSTKSSKLCTFSTPFGRYRFLRMPFGINCAPEIFHNEMFKIFKDEGIILYIDDILVVGRNKAEHDLRLKQVMQKAKEYNIKFNKEKCIFGVKEVNFLGHIFDKNGMRPDTRRVTAIQEMPAPNNKKELERFLGITNYLSRFIANYSEIASPLRDLLKKDSEFIWNNIHNNSFKKLKDRVTNAPVLRYYSADEEVTVSVDASAHGLGACLLQGGRPVIYAARSLTPTEMRWAQIEKELLAIVFGCTRFHQYVYGHRKVIIETDHKPLESIFKKPLNSTPARLQRMLLVLQGYELEIHYKPGNQMFIADALSRAPVGQEDNSDIQEKVTIHVNALIENVRVSTEWLNKIKSETNKDRSLQSIQKYYLNGWPEAKNNLDNLAKQYWSVKNEIHMIDGIVFRNDQIIIPFSLRKEMLKKIHEGHLGIEKCKRRAKEVLWWPGMGADIEQMIQSCDICLRHRDNQSREPLQPHAIPDLPWQVIAADIFQIDQRYYLLLVDYYSKFIEILPVKNVTTSTIVANIKNVFARFGIPEKLITDNGPQFTSEEFAHFIKQWEFTHITSSPLYPRSNGLAERNVQTAKKLLIKAKEEGGDWQLALLNFRNTPISRETYSPAQLLMGRRLNTKLPTSTKLLKPTPITPQCVKKERQSTIVTMKNYYDQKTKPLPVLKPGEKIRMRCGKLWTKAKVDQKASGDRSYWVTTDNGSTYRRNRNHLLKLNRNYREQPPNKNTFYDDIIYPTVRRNSSNEGSTQSTSPARERKDYHTITKSGRQIRAPDRFMFN